MGDGVRFNEIVASLEAERDAARAEVARLTHERDETARLRVELEHMAARDAVVQAEVAALHTQIDDGEAEVERLTRERDEADEVLNYNLFHAEQERDEAVSAARTADLEVKELRAALLAYYQADTSSTGCDCWGESGHCRECDSYLRARGLAVPLLSKVRR